MVDSERRKALARVLRRDGGFLLGVAVVALLLWPRTRVTVPAWTLTIVQENAPAEGVTVRQVWRDYSTLSGAGEQDLLSDRAGRVSFPERTTHASTLHRAAGCMAQVLAAGVHASCGPSASVIAFDGGHEGDGHYVPGRPLPTVVVMKRRVTPMPASGDPAASRLP